MEKTLMYENVEKQMGVDEDGNIIDLCLNENKDDEQTIDSETLCNLLIESAKVYQMKNYGHLL